jgi:hypothetical protein
MTTDLAKARTRRASLVWVGAAIVSAAAAVTMGIDTRSRANESRGLVLPDFVQRADNANKITIVSKDARYEIVDTPRGWALRDRGNFPVRRERLAQFTEGLKSLEFVRPMTRDPDKHERLGLGDPALGGAGVLVEVEGASGARLVEVIIGGQPGGALYARLPSDPQTWEVKGDLPPLRDPALWLDLVPYAIDETRVRTVEIYPEVGPGYFIARDDEASRFTLQRPFAGLPIVAALGLGPTGVGLAEVRPIDVQVAAALPGPPRARARMTTADGLMIDAEFYVDGRGWHWVKLIARSEDLARAEEVATINAEAAPWAYRITERDYRTLAPTLPQLTEPEAPLTAAPQAL